MQYARHEWVEHRAAWRLVIFFNLIRTVIHVLDVLLREMSISDTERGSPDSDYTSGSSDREPSPHVFSFTDKHRLLKLRLAPLRRVQTDLEKRLGPGTHEVYTSDPAAVVLPEGKTRELGVISRNGWKSVFEKLRPAREGESCSEPIQKRRDEENYEIADILVGCKQDMKSLWEDTVVQQILTHHKAHIEDSPDL